MPETLSIAGELAAEDAVVMEQYEALMTESYKYPLLSAEEEIELSKHIRAGLGAAEELESTDMSASRRLEIDHIIQTGAEAKGRMILSNIRLVAKSAKWYYYNHPLGKRYGLMDLVQEGILGTAHAAEKFDPDKGFKFSTYATWWINQNMQRALQDKATDLSIPNHVFDVHRKLRNCRDAGLSEEETMAELNISKSRLVELQISEPLLKGQITSIDMKLDKSREDSATLGDILPDIDSEKDFTAISGDEDEKDLFSEESIDVLSFLEPHLSKSDSRLLNKLVRGGPLTVGEEGQRVRFRGLMDHPALIKTLKQLHPVGDEMASDWRDEAACADEPEIFTNPRQHTKERAVEICGSCAVRSECRAYFFQRKPQRGRWADGMTHSNEFVKSSKAKSRRKA